MMSSQTFAVNSNNDIYLNTDGNIAIVYDIDSLVQICTQVARTRLGELVLNIDQGIPFFETVFNGVPNIQQFNASLRLAFLNVTGVVEVVSLMTNQSKDILSYNAMIRTIYGGGIVSGRLI